jgi:hypothetical protein
LAAIGFGQAPAPATAVHVDARLSGYTLPAIRQGPWNPGLNAVGGIPNYTTACATLAASTYGNGSMDARGGIQTAINGCTVGQYVSLGCGVYALTSGPILINKGIVVRGCDGNPDDTEIDVADGTSQSVVVIGPRQYLDSVASFGSTMALTADAVRGTSTATVTSTTGLSMGQVVLIDKLADSAYTAYNQCDTASTGTMNSCQGWFSRLVSGEPTGRPIAQIMEIASLTSTTITFTTPFHMTFDTAHTAELTQYASGLQPVKNAGLENVWVHGGEGGDGGGNILLSVAEYSWVKNVDSDWFNGSALRMYECFRCVIRDSYAHESKSPNPGGAGYLIDFSWATSDSLIENNIAVNGNKVIVSRAGGGGNVIAYNYLDEGYGAGYPTIPEVGANASHMTTPHYELFEGNQTFNLGGDARWGSSVYITFFRNWATIFRNLSGNPLPPSSTSLSDATEVRGVMIGAYHHYYSFVGNVIGSSGMATTTTYGTNPSLHDGNTGFQYCTAYDTTTGCADASFNFSPNIPIWVFGYPDSTQTGVSITSSSVANPTVITIPADSPVPLGGSAVVISGHSGSTPSINNTYTATYVSPTTFTIPVNVTTGGTGGTVSIVDNAVATTALRDGNYDYATSSVHWDSAVAALPASFYLSSKPGFFYNCSWPWVNAVPSGQTLTLPAYWRFLHGTPFSTTSPC